MFKTHCVELTNKEIYVISNNLLENFSNQVYYLPIKINFYLQKNLKIFLDANETIEKLRSDIIVHYGEIKDEGNSYFIPEHNIIAANKEFDELLSLKQKIEYTILPLSSFGELELSNKQMQAILFMIEDDTEKKEE